MPGIKIIGLSMFEEAERAAAMREAGAVGYLAKSGPSDALLEAIRTLARSEEENPAE
jgi:DNA-binding NarL/FixJ family response regulator